MTLQRKQKNYNLDAAGIPLGRLASRIAELLRGKKERNYVPHLDPLVIVKVKNLDKIVLTGKKASEKIYRHHSGHPGGLKEVKYPDLVKKNPDRALKLAVLRMLHKNRLRAKLMKRLIVE